MNILNGSYLWSEATVLLFTNLFIYSICTYIVLIYLLTLFQLFFFFQISCLWGQFNFVFLSFFRCTAIARILVGCMSLQSRDGLIYNSQISSNL